MNPLTTARAPQLLASAVFPEVPHQLAAYQKEAPPAPDNKPGNSLARHLSQFIEPAIKVIETGDPALRPTMEKVFGDPPRAKFEIISNDQMAALARQTGRAATTDSMTLTAAVVGPDGKVKDLQHTIYVCPRAFSQDGKSVALGQLAVTLQHELYHIKRFEDGTVTAKTYDPAVEELRTFETSVGAARTMRAAVDRGVETLRKTNPEGAKFYEGVSAQIGAAITKDEHLRDSFRRPGGR